MQTYDYEIGSIVGSFEADNIIKAREIVLTKIPDTDQYLKKDDTFVYIPEIKIKQRKALLQ